MNRLLSLTIMLNALLSGAASAADSLCINPKYSHETHALDSHNVAARQTIGERRPWLQLTTSCFDLKSAYRIALSSQFLCVGRGDIVVSRTIDGQTQSCRVTQLAPLASYTPDNHG